MCVNADASLDAGHQFDWYDGGGLDVAVLSFAQLDAAGNVNVGRFGGRLPGVGGFINISQGAKRLVFVGTLVAGGGAPVVGGDRPLTVPDDGAAKLVKEVEQISFSAARARQVGQPVVYITERAVFELDDDGIVLTEVAPGLDLEKDVLAHMDFRPAISSKLKEIDHRVYRPEPMRLALADKGEA
jgi:propionate CoA-transferase